MGALKHGICKILMSRSPRGPRPKLWISSIRLSHLCKPSLLRLQYLTLPPLLLTFLILPTLIRELSISSSSTSLPPRAFKKNIRSPTIQHTIPSG